MIWSQRNRDLATSRPLASFKCPVGLADALQGHETGTLVNRPYFCSIRFEFSMTPNVSVNSVSMQ
jgi:hypothetical protein